MSLFAVRKTRRFNHQYIYVDERRERLGKIEQQARRELGMTSPEKYDADRFRGAFSVRGQHRRMSSGLALFMLILLLMIIYFFFI